MKGASVYASFLMISLFFISGIYVVHASGQIEDARFNGPPEPSGIGTGTDYYLSANGEDSSDGLSRDTAWRSPGRLRSQSLKPGDRVFFERDGVYRLPENSPEGMQPAGGNPSAWILYGAWGIGAKPVLIGSVDLSDSADWQNLEDGLWRSSEALPADVGQVYVGDDASFCHKKWQISYLIDDGDFVSDDFGYLLMRSSRNPGKTYGSIEAALTRHLIDQDGLEYAVFEDMAFRYGGAHGFGGGNTSHIIIRDCEFSFIGGGILPGLTSESGDPVRYGNAVEFWGNADNHLVEGNYIHDIYDTALTNQNHGATVSQNNIYYINNMVFNCGLASFELWTRPAASAAAHIYFLHNTCVNPGNGWGADRPDTNSFQVAAFSHQARTEDVVIAGNIFATTQDPDAEGEALLYFDSNPSGPGNGFSLRHNLWYSVVSDGVALWFFGLDSEVEFFSSYEEFREAGGTGSDGAWGHPGFMDEAGGDWRPSPESPANDLGDSTTVYLRLQDAAGYSVSGVPDAGAFEGP